MSLCQLFVQPEAVFRTVGELGEAGIAQFKDVSRKNVIKNLGLNFKIMETLIVKAFLIKTFSSALRDKIKFTGD